MNDPHRLAGTYLLGLEPMFVSVVDGDILLRLDGVPKEFGARLVGSDNFYVVHGSQLDGATLTFDDGEPAPGGQLGGVIDFVRSDEEVPNTSGKGLLLGVVNWEANEENAYQEMADRFLEYRDGLAIEWRFPWPKWRFVEWLSRQGEFIFHGSPLPDVDTFLPRRNSVEIRDKGGTGNRAAVYGTPYGLWAMWFAVIDRDKLKGSIRNSAMSWPDPSGNPTTLYRFTVHKDFVGGDIWRTGTLYLFSKADFEPITFYPGGPESNEWASTSELRPLARLTIDPTDFPFLDRVGGHDDGELIEAEVVGDIVMSKVTAARSVPGGMIVDLSWDEEVAGVWDEYMATRRRFSPDVERNLSIEPEGRATMELRGPEGFLQAFATSLLKSGIPVEA